MKVAVIGLGEFGVAAALGLARNGADVIAVDRSMDRVNTVKDEVSVAIRLDASQPDAFEEHGLGEVDVLVAAIGNNFEAQVLVVVHAKKAGIKRVIARATTADHCRVLEAVGADEVFNPEEEAAQWMVQRLTLGSISKYFELAEGFSMVEVSAPAGLVGKSLAELDLRRRFRVNLIAIKQMKGSVPGRQQVERFNPAPKPEDVIKEGDVLALAGSVLDLAGGGKISRSSSEDTNIVPLGLR